MSVAETNDVTHAAGHEFRKLPLRIGFYAFFPGGGIGRYTHELMRALGGYSEVELELLCSPAFEWKEAAEYRTWDGLYELWSPSPLLRRLRFLRGQFFNPLRAIRHAERADLDVIHLSNVNHLTFPLWRRALRRSGIRLAVSVHDVQRGKAMISRRWEDRQLKAVYREADALFVHSEYQASELAAFAGVDRGRVVIVPHGPYDHGPPTTDPGSMRRQWGLPAAGEIALFFGQIRDDKNLEGLLRALALMDDPPHLLVVGRSGSRLHKTAEYYIDMADRLGVASDVTFKVGYIPDEQVPDVFAMIDFVVLPYRRTFTSQSGVLNVAASYDRPVVVSSAPVLSETVGGCDVGVVCESDEPPSLAQGMETMMEQLHDRHQYAFAEYRRRYSWAENARRTLAVYASFK